MLYRLVEWIGDFPGASLFQFLTFRAVLAAGFSLVISIYIGRRVILFLRSRLIGESIRKLGPDTHKEKAGTPTMGGLIIITAIVVPTLLWANLSNMYVLLILLATVWMGVVGFADDYIKVFKKRKAGLKGKFKIIGQMVLGLIVGLTMMLHPHFSGRNPHVNSGGIVRPNEILKLKGFERGDEITRIGQAEFDRVFETPGKFPAAADTAQVYGILRPVPNSTDKNPMTITVKADNADVYAALFGTPKPGFRHKTNLPFLKNETFDYASLVFWADSPGETELSIVYVLVVIFIVTAVSNAVNITDGLDGLAAGTMAIAGGLMGIFAYISGNAVFADYLNIAHVPMGAELFVFAAALVGACIGFLWYNAYPAQIFMGDTGSLALGGALGVLALMVKKELLLPVICGVFFVESLSVIFQVAYFKYTKRRFGEGRRLLKMSPLHHHYELLGWQEPKIVTRFWIVSILLVLLAFATLKIR